MYCYHCGKKIDERKLEKKTSSYSIKDENGELLEMNDETKVYYVCPQCGHLTHLDASEEDLKSLSRATHSQLQRGENHFAFGMGFISIGVIVTILAVIFCLLSFKTEGGQRYLRTTCSEFYVFIGLTIIGVILLVYGIVYTIIGLKKKIVYSALLKDLNNKTFVQ